LLEFIIGAVHIRVMVSDMLARGPKQRDIVTGA